MSSSVFILAFEVTILETRLYLISLVGYYPYSLMVTRIEWCSFYFRIESSAYCQNLVTISNDSEETFETNCPFLH